jgi:hypothetical protein
VEQRTKNNVVIFFGFIRGADTLIANPNILQAESDEK